MGRCSIQHRILRSTSRRKVRQPRSLVGLGVPVGSFGDAQVMIDGVLVPVMSTAGMLAMKEQFPQLRNGRPWRPKQIRDLATLREMLAKDERDAQPLPP